MGCCCCLFWIGLLVFLYYVIKKIYNWLYNIPEIPKIDENLWWGPGKATTEEDTSIKPFKINISNQELDDLKQRLSNNRQFTPPLEGIHHEYGINTNLLKEIQEYWLTKYNWREREAFLNTIPQFTTKIQGLNIHFAHIKPTDTTGLKVLPLILLHGWPGSVREFYECIPKLIKPNKNHNFVFEVVIPHIPGYCFSEAAVRPGMNTTIVATIFKKLMERLQFDKWYVEGGDWGSEIGTQMAILYPEKVLGLHLTMAATQMPKATVKRLIGSFCPSLIVSKKHQNRIYPIKNSIANLLRESGYFHIQATRPDTLGVALKDSPIGLAAYLIEKYIVWTHVDNKSRQDGGLTLKFGYEKLLDLVMIYWFSNSITTSMRLYAETMAYDNPYKKIKRIPVKVPSAYAQFGNDLVYMPKTLLTDKFPNLVQYSEFPTGGHFAAFEEPDYFTEDLWNAVEKFEKCNSL